MVAAGQGSGLFRPHARGFGFVDLDVAGALGDGDVASCFVPPVLTDGLLADDRVSVSYDLTEDGRVTATAVDLLTRERTEVFGVVETTDTGPVLRVDPHIGHGRWELVGRTEDLPAGVAVLADVVGPRQADPSDEWEDPLAPDTLLERIRVRHRIPEDYPPTALVEADTVAAQAGRDRPERVPRRDLREMVTFTIDAPTSRDLDDALSVYPADPDGGIRVLVHIADVAAHVPADGALDAEARRAATSVYLPGWTRPMLPTTLSEQALSLLPGQDRDALTVEMRIAPDGTVTAADVVATRIRSDLRLSYEQAAEVLANRPVHDVPDDVARALRWLRTAGARLGVQRLGRGGLEAPRVEPELTVRVHHGHAEQVAATPSNAANQLIERLMVAANEAVAGWLVARGLPGVFRVHPPPAQDAAPALEAFCAAVGFHPGFGGRLSPLGLAALAAPLDAAADQTAAAVWDVLLGFLGRAAYTPTPGPHFGLASDGYLHFTSPIRRYADLAVHRILHTYLAGERNPSAYPNAPELEDLCAGINTSAGTAARAESQLRKAFWLLTLPDDPNAELPGRVTGVNDKGLFVTLDGGTVSGFLAARELRGRAWALSDDRLALVSSDGRRLGFGEQLTVRIANADPESGQLELRPVGALARPPARSRYSERQLPSPA